MSIRGRKRRRLGFAEALLILLLGARVGFAVCVNDTTCTSNSTCPGGFCDNSALACKGCGTLPTPTACISGVPCGTNPDCPGGSCNGASHVCEGCAPTPTPPPPCIGGADCVGLVDCPGGLCNTDSNTCDCSGTPTPRPTGTACIQNAPCTFTTDCGVGSCDVGGCIFCPTQTPTPSPSPSPTPQEGGGDNQSCIDGIDNNGNGLTDCADPGCANTPPCGAPAPTLSPRSSWLLIGVLLTVGGLALWRSRIANR